MLSHRNMLSNAAQARAVVDFGREDTVFNVLPMFHAFGLTIGTIVPIVFGVKVYLYPSPLHYRIIPELIYGSNATILFGTDTFLAGYAKVANAYDLRSLRYVMAGAEPVKDSTRNTYLEKFGLRILEGYGITEMAPVLALNTPMFNKNGTVGRMMPGMSRTARAGAWHRGRRQARRQRSQHDARLSEGRSPRRAAAAEGRLARHRRHRLDDAQGFIKIKGRAKRFAKVAGEMVSLAAIETLAAELWPDDVSAAASLPDARKGERIVLVTQHKGATRSDLHELRQVEGRRRHHDPRGSCRGGDDPAAWLRQARLRGCETPGRGAGRRTRRVRHRS